MVELRDTLPVEMAEDLEARRRSVHEKITALEKKDMVQRRVEGDKVGLTEKGENPDNFRGMTHSRP